MQNLENTSAFFAKKWAYSDYYNFDIEFNRIEKYNEYVENWLKNYYNFSFETLTHKTDWNENDIVDVNDFNRVKSNMKILLEQLRITHNINIIYDHAQNFDVNKANEIEINLNSILQVLGEEQFTYDICGLFVCDTEDSLKLNF